MTRAPVTGDRRFATRADLVIVGAGLAGSAAAWAAARRGLDVVVLEAFEPGHRNGSSHGSARIFRRVYADPLYVRMTGRAGDLWRRLEDESGQRLVTLTGGLDFGPVRDPGYLYQVLAGCGVTAELVQPDEAARRWPGFRFGGGAVLYHPQAGVLDPDRAIAAMLDGAAARGADIRFGTPVTGVERSGSGGAAIRTADREFTAPAAVIAAGAWLEPLIGGLVDLPPLTVTQEQILHLPPWESPRAPGTADRLRSPGVPQSPGLSHPADLPQPAGPAQSAATGPPWPTFIYEGEAACFYGLPGGRDAGVPGAVKIGEHHAGKRVTAATRDFALDPVRTSRILDFAAGHLPGLDNSNKRAEDTCLYTTTGNEDFILDRHGPFVIASACSGHGAKFAPLLGEIIADLAQGRPPEDPRFTLAAHREAAHSEAAHSEAAHHEAEAAQSGRPDGRPATPARRRGHA